MPKRSLVILAFVILVLLGGALSFKGEKKPEAPRLQVIVANADIVAGQFVRADTHLALADWPKENITDAMLTNENSKLTDFDGAVARRAFAKGEPMLKNQMVRSTEGGFMAAVLDAGKRAVSIAVDSTSGNAGFIFPGDRVDLILTHAVSRQSVQSRASETFIEDVRVLAVDQRLDNPENKAVLAKTVTLEVTPKQAEEINLAKDLGKISLSLRSLASSKKPAVVTPPVATGDITAGEPESLDDILRNNGGANPAEPAATSDSSAPNVTRDTEVSRLISPEDAAGSQVTVIRGSERTQVQFGPPNSETPREP